MATADYDMDYDIVDDSYYLFACAQLKAREKDFIEKSRLERMASAGSIEDFLKILSETYYSRYLNLINPEKNFDEAIIAFNNEALAFLNVSLKPGHRSAIDLIMYEENIHNYKLILKALILKEDLKHLFLPFPYSYEALIGEIEGRNLIEIDPIVKLYLDKIILLKDRDKDFKKAELEFEKFYMETLCEHVLKIGSRMLKDFIMHVIDIINIKNISRVKYAKSGMDFGEFLIEGGFLKTGNLKKFETESNDSFVQEFGNSHYSTIVRKGINSLYTYNTFFSFEKNEYIFYLNFFDKVKYSVANIEKIVSFFLRKKIEIKILNIIYLGLLYSIDKGNIMHKVEIISEN